MVASGLWAVVLGVVATSVLLAQLGVEQFGLWALIQTFSIINGWSSVLVVGLATTCTRRTSALSLDLNAATAGGSFSVLRLRSVARTNGAPWEAAAGIILIVGIAAAIALAALAPIIVTTIADLDATTTSSTVAALRWFSLQMVADAGFVAIAATFEGLQRLSVARGFDAFRRALTLGSAMAISFVSSDVSDVLAVQATVALAGLAAAAALTGLSPRLPSLHDIRSYLRESSGPSAINASGVTHRMMDRAIVAIMLGPAAVAIVEVASRLLDAVRLVLASTSQATLSAAPWMRARGADEKLRRLTITATRLTAGVTLIAAGTVVALRRPILELWTDETTAVAASPLLVFGLLHVALQTPFQVVNNVMIGLGRFRRLAIAGWTAVLVNFGATIWLVGQNGVVGAFQGTLAGTLVIIVMLFPVLLETTGASPATLLRSTIGPAIPAGCAALAAGLAVTLLDIGPPRTLVLGSIAAGLAATATAWAFGLTSDERRWARAVIQGRTADRTAPATVRSPEAANSPTGDPVHTS